MASKKEWYLESNHPDFHTFFEKNDPEQWL